MTKKRRQFTEEFKKQIVNLAKSGKPRKEIIEEYELTSSAYDRWLKQDRETGSFKEKDNRTDEENELLKLKKELEQLKMENDILKQAALIMGRK